MMTKHKQLKTFLQNYFALFSYIARLRTEIDHPMCLSAEMSSFSSYFTEINLNSSAFLHTNNLSFIAYLQKEEPKLKQSPKNKYFHRQQLMRINVICKHIAICHKLHT